MNWNFKAKLIAQSTEERVDAAVVDVGKPKLQLPACFVRKLCKLPMLPSLLIGDCTLPANAHPDEAGKCFRHHSNHNNRYLCY